MDEEKVIQVVKEIFDKYGMENLRNRKTREMVVKSYIPDMLNKTEYRDENMVLTQAMKSDAIGSLVTANVTGDVAKKVIDRLENEEHMRRDDAEFVVRCVVLARGKSPDIPASDQVHNTKEAEQKYQPTDHTQKEVSLVQELFQVHSEDFDIDGLTAWKQMRTLIDEGYTVDRYIETLNAICLNHREMAMECIHQELWHMVEERISNLRLPDEKMIVYLNEGIFLTGKQGFLVSDKRIYWLNKSKIIYLNIDKIKSLHKTVNSGDWFFNNNMDLMVGKIGCTAAEMGVILALICTLVRECHSKGYKIEIDKQP